MCSVVNMISLHSYYTYIYWNVYVVQKNRMTKITVAYVYKISNICTVCVDEESKYGNQDTMHL